jgi:tetratricopeptide (TPR) repeat protein
VVHEALRRAEMLFIAGERAEALTAVRDALLTAPKLPYGLVLLAALEASNVRRGQEQKLRDIIRRLDGIIEANPKVRHGRFYRARLQKRLGDLGAAIADLRRAAVDDPDDLDVLNELEACERKEAEPPPTPASGGSMLDRLLRKL